MKLLAAAASASVLLGSIQFSGAESQTPLPPASVPTAQPLAAALPATQPVPINLAPANPAPANLAAAGPAQLLLLPFTSVDPTDRRDWIANGILTGLQSDLSRLPSVQPITVDTSKSENAPPANGYDTEAVSRLARSVGARFVIFGTYQINEPELRLVGVIFDAEAGRPIGGIKATGTLRDIFGMEDSLSMQAKRQLPQLPVVAQIPPVNVPPNVPPVAVQQPAAPLPPNNWNNNGPVRAPLPPPVAFDDDAARQSIERIRNRDDWFPAFPDSFSPYFGGFGPLLGYGSGSGLYPVTVTVYPSRPTHRSPNYDPMQDSEGNTLFRGGLRLGNYISPTDRNGNYVRPTPQTGNYIQPTPQTGNYVHPTPQTGNYVRPTPQTSNYVHPTPQTGTTVQPAK